MQAFACRNMGRCRTRRLSISPVPVTGRMAAMAAAEAKLIERVKLKTLAEGFEQALGQQK